MREPLIPDPNADRLPKALKHLTKNPRVYSTTPSPNRSAIGYTSSRAMDRFRARSYRTARTGQTVRKTGEGYAAQSRAILF